MQILVLAGFTIDERTLFKDILIAHSTPEEWELGTSIGGPEQYAEILWLLPVNSYWRIIPEAVTCQIAAGIEAYLHTTSLTCGNQSYGPARFCHRLCPQCR